MSNSVTDIAARLILDSSELVQGLKFVEQKFVDFSKSTASPFYPGSAPDQGAAHVDAYKAQDKIAEQKLIQETIAARNREEMLMASLRREQQMAIENAKQTAAAEQEIAERSAALQAAIRERFAKEDSGWIAQQAKVNAEIIKKFNDDADAYLKRAEAERHQQWINNYNERRMIVQEDGVKKQAVFAAGVPLPDITAVKANMQATADAEQEIVERSAKLKTDIEERYAAEKERKLRRARELDNKAYEENKSLQERAFRDGHKIRQNQAAVDERAAKEAAQRAKEINAPQEDAHVIAYRIQQEREANDQRQRGLALVRSLATAQDLHNERVQEYTSLRKNNIITEQQYAAAVSRSAVIMNASNIGAGRFSGAMTQMSFAVEDFIQVTAMGGGLNMALMSASNNISMVVRALIPASSLLGTIAGSAIPLVLVGAGMMASKFLETKSAVEQLNEELSKLRDNSYIDIRISSAIDFESVKNIRSYEEGMRQAAAAADDLRKAQLEERLARNAANSAIEKTIMGLEEAQAIVTSQTGPTDVSAEYVDYSAKGERAMQAYQNAYAEMNREIVNGINTQADARRVLTEFTNAISNQTLGSGGSEIFADQIDLLQQILKQGSESELMKFFDDIEKQNARVFDAEQKIEESRKRAEEARVRAIESAKEELRIKQQEQLLLMGMTDQEKERYDLMKERNQFIGFDPQAVAGLGLSGALQAGQGMAAGMLFLESKAAQLEKEIQTLQQSSSPEIVGGMQQNAFDAQADAFKQIFAAANKQPNPQLTRQIQLLQDIKTAVQQGGVLQIVQ